MSFRTMSIIEMHSKRIWYGSCAVAPLPVGVTRSLYDTFLFSSFFTSFPGDCSLGSDD